MAAAASASAPTSKQKESFLGRLNRKIEAIKITDAGYDTVDFLKAIRKIPGVFALIIGEGKTTSMLASDVQGNIDALIKVHKNKPFATLRACPKKSPAISESPQIKLLWLKRGLVMIYQLLVTLVDQPALKTMECANAAYQKSLARHHNFIMRGVAKVGLSMGGIPDRPALYAKLGVAKDGFEKEIIRVKKSFGVLLVKLHEVLVKEMKQETSDLDIKV